MMLRILIVKILQKELADKILKNRAFNIAKDPKYDGYQRGLPSMVYKFFDKKPQEVVQSTLILKLHLKISN